MSVIVYIIVIIVSNANIIVHAVTQPVSVIYDKKFLYIQYVVAELIY